MGIFAMTSLRTAKTRIPRVQQKLTQMVPLRVVCE